MVDVPQAVRGKALAAGAGWWLDELPSLVASIERDLVDLGWPRV